MGSIKKINGRANDEWQPDCAAWTLDAWSLAEYLPYLLPERWGKKNPVCSIRVRKAVT